MKSAWKYWYDTDNIYIELIKYDLCCRWRATHSHGVGRFQQYSCGWHHFVFLPVCNDRFTPPVSSKMCVPWMRSLGAQSVSSWSALLLRWREEVVRYGSAIICLCVLFTDVVVVVALCFYLLVLLLFIYSSYSSALLVVFCLRRINVCVLFFFFISTATW